MLTGGVGLFLKAVQHVHRIFKLGYLHHPVPTVLLVHDDLFGAAAYLVKRLSMVWV